MNARIKISQWCFALAIAGACQSLLADEFLQRLSVQQYLRNVSAEHSLNQTQLNDWFSGLRSQQGIIDAISRPAERVLTWREYRPIFVTDARIEGGKAFALEHEALLAEAEKTFGVPAHVITAIIGVETYYGKFTGKHRVIEALATLAFDYPKRADFFRRELTEFLVLSDQEKWQTRQVMGSYAGAMGMPQFIASSYQRYAIDFDGDGQRDLFDNVADIIGSVANYLAVHGWVKDAPIAERWSVEGAASEPAKALVRESLKPAVDAETLERLGFQSDRMSQGMQPKGLASVMLFPIASQEELWVTYQNFYAITRYNHSRMYAMAVFQLAQAIERSSS